MSDPNLKEHARRYCKQNGFSLGKQLGSGQYGAVWASSNISTASAIKAFERIDNYNRELRCYLRLQEYSIDSLKGFAIPVLIGFSEGLMVIEIGLVNPPYLLDFGKAHIDNPPEFSPEVWRDWQEQRSELFEERWPQVRKLISALESYGIHYYDAKPGNIMFGDEFDDV